MDKMIIGHGTTINEKIAKGEIKKIDTELWGKGVQYPPKDININSVMSGLTNFLLAKNKNYGNSALKPLKVFSKVEPTNGICVRMDDKISRIANAKELRKNDIVDLTGYLVLLCAQKGWDDFKELID